MRLLGTAVVLAALVATSSCGSQEEGDRAFHGCRAADVPGAGSGSPGPTWTATAGRTGWC